MQFVNDHMKQSKNKTKFCEWYTKDWLISLSLFFIFITKQFYLRITRCLAISFRPLPCRCSFSVRIPMDEAAAPSPYCYHWIEHLHVRMILWKFIKIYRFFIRSSKNSIFFKIRFTCDNIITSFERDLNFLGFLTRLKNIVFSILIFCPIIQIIFQVNSITRLPINVRTNFLEL